MFGGHQAVWRSVPGDKLVEIIYQDVKGQKIGRVRKAKAIDDISGDYKQYANIEKLAVGKGYRNCRRGTIAAFAQLSGTKTAIAIL